MLKSSLKEYDYLKKEVSYIRDSIIKFIGFIISIGGFSIYAIEFIFEKYTPTGTLALILISVIIITFLFKIVWYKFNSFNRHVGYIQLLMQEDNYINRSDISKDQIKSKDYIENYRNYIQDSPKTGILYDREKPSWEYIMHRYNSSTIWNGKLSFEENKENLNTVMSKIKFVFDLPLEYEYQKISKFEKLDEEFFSKIIYEIYRKDNFFKNFFRNFSKENIKLNTIKRIVLNFINFLSSIKSILWYNESEKQIIKKPFQKIDKRYFINGWGFPKLLTQIAFLTITALTIVFYYICRLQFTDLELSIDNAKKMELMIVPIMSVILAIIFLYYWLYRFVYGLKDISYGRSSIDGYCWEFFIYRVEMLNALGVIPVYQSKSFVRFFKTKLILEYMNTYEPEISSKTKEEYLSALASFKQFDKGLRKYHKTKNKQMKRKYKID